MSVRLKDRDPRNPAHVRAALDILQAHGKPRMTSEAAMILRAMGRSRLENIIISDVPRKGERVVGSHFFIEHGLTFANNIIATCDGCRAPLEMRPSGIKEKFCVFCAAEDVLQSQAALRRDGRPSRSGRK